MKTLKTSYYLNQLTFTKANVFLRNHFWIRKPQRNQHCKWKISKKKLLKWKSKNQRINLMKISNKIFVWKWRENLIFAIKIRRDSKEEILQQLISPKTRKKREKMPKILNSSIVIEENKIFDFFFYSKSKYFHRPLPPYPYPPLLFLFCIYLFIIKLFIL